MKKLVALLSALIIAMSCLFLFGCGADGTYKFYSVTEKGEDGAPDVVYYVGDKYNGETITEDYMSFALNSDGTATFTVKVNDKHIATLGTWSNITGEHYKFVVDQEGADPLVIKISGNSLTYEAKNGEIVVELRKESKFLFF